MVSYAMAVQGNRLPLIEPNDPMFIHPSDHPGQTLVANVFCGDDFDSWKRTFLRALSSKNKVGFVDGKVAQPEADSPLLPYWQRCNDLVASWILNSLHKDISGSVLYCNTAAEMWEELVERFGQSNKAKLFQVKKELSGISQGDSDIATYYTRAKKIWDEFAAVDDMPKCTCNKCECGINVGLMKYAQQQNMIHFLMGLNDSYTSVRGSLLMMNPLPSLSQTYSLLIQEERQRQVRNAGQFLSDTASSFTAGAGASKPPFQSSQRRTEGRRPFCDHCKKPGHTVDRCYKLHGYPTKQQQVKPKGSKYANNAWSLENQAEDSTQAVTQSSTLQLPGLDVDQSKQLLQFLANLQASKQSTQESHGHPTLQDSASVHMAVIRNGICKHLCLKLFPQLCGIARVIDVSSTPKKCAGVGCSRSIEWDHLKEEHRLYTTLARGLTSSYVGECLADAISASSTDNYPEEGIHNTLESRDRIGRRPSYWSSSGQSNPEVPERLTYKLISDICVITEINIQPFQAFFQRNTPIYSAKAVRFRTGYRILPDDYEQDFKGHESKTSAEKFMWTYTSQEFPMVQESGLQNFKLPQPVLCIGGYLQIELLGRVQKQAMDDLYYICVAYVQVLGRSLSPVFEVEVLEPSGRFVLFYNPQAQFSAPPIIDEGNVEITATP